MIAFVATLIVAFFCFVAGILVGSREVYDVADEWFPVLFSWSSGEGSE